MLNAFMRCLVATLLALLVTAAHAAYPERPITLIVPWGAGGGTDA
ncbi:MAG: tripartite tricarboxylate transporter substrate binding protein, partial [Betaproteobacteria bacterium]